eukprot:CAMPEP_0174365118 /NCGR_PEP_ID=MMETSP0811_2-20130205/75938_1 /TAXON_ID=73025 ORGANISM="Eutreptiella gymnastica-like, Strain CCMP1594" /NCGR_SAMPLE_ID=MMETSP0811_2 /ASSEMBLY_ACC=CAM_ASM_000667 /LENGTH=53 /DNA_ID=CAMNT_0015505461 /DNA_START=380 /DNA_END=538 /DNA_ORIENTATION=+
MRCDKGNERAPGTWAGISSQIPFIAQTTSAVGRNSNTTHHEQGSCDISATVKT